MNALRTLVPLTLLLAACEPPPGEDRAEIRAQYKGRFSSACASWVTSPNTYTKYCSSPYVAWDKDQGYALAAPAKADDSAFEGYDAKSADEKKAVLMAEGEKTYKANCAACHQANGEGLAGNFPPLAGDPVANGGSADEHIGIVLNGLSGKVINGVSYAAAMTPYAGQLNDNQIAAVVTYERNSWGNNGGVVEPTQVAALRK